MGGIIKKHKKPQHFQGMRCFFIRMGQENEEKKKKKKEDKKIFDIV